MALSILSRTGLFLNILINCYTFMLKDDITSESLPAQIGAFDGWKFTYQPTGMWS